MSGRQTMTRIRSYISVCTSLSSMCVGQICKFNKEYQIVPCPLVLSIVLPQSTVGSFKRKLMLSETYGPYASYAIEHAIFFRLN